MFLRKTLASCAPLLRAVSLGVLLIATDAHGQTMGAGANITASDGVLEAGGIKTGTFAERCLALASDPQVSAVGVVTAQLVPAGPVSSSVRAPLRNPTLQASNLPEHCLITGSFERRLGAGNKPYAIGFELRIPSTWNERLLFQGGGAFKGIVESALGVPAIYGSSSSLGLTRGFAVVTSDSGHAGAPSDASFTEDQLARVNYAYASIGKVIRIAKVLIVKFSGAPPERTYFSGCSNGGREAMEAALRFPEEFDGVIAANPAHDFGKDALLTWHSASTLAKIAPKAADGAYQPWLALTQEDWAILSKGIVEQCDAADGLKDGLIFNQKACHFSPHSLLCRPGKTGGCLSRTKVDAVDAAFRGPRSAAGSELTPSWTYDAGIGSTDWLAGQLGYIDASGKLVGYGIYNQLPNAVLTKLFRYPAVAPTQVIVEPPEDTISAMEVMQGLINTTQTQFSTFGARGGKLLFIHGWSDPSLAPAGFVRWFDKLRDDTRLAGKSADEFARLFLVPGMTHCGGGRSLDDFDALEALIEWVERSNSPESLVATGKAFPGVSRPICAYPRFARYNGKGDPALAGSFTCQPE